jgi:CRISPR/Cas system CSM-associated protein Csm3 (group 7 of RAMP superfamily)
MTAQWENSRGIRTRIVVEGSLVLETPAHFGNGDTDQLTDIPLVRDPLRRVALLTGSSLAGALRNYIREYETGFGSHEQHNIIFKSRAQQLFGDSDNADPENPAVHQSWLVVEDARGDVPRVEIRDGVTLNFHTRTAQEKKKYDFQVLEAGNSFPLGFELALTNTGTELLEAFAIGLDGLAKGAIRLGKRKNRGYGRCRVQEWSVRIYDLCDPRQMIMFLDDDRSNIRRGANIFDLLDVRPTLQDHRDQLTLTATFRLDGALMIRAATDTPSLPDFVHLRSSRGGKFKPILSGTSLAGAMRARAHRIANTIVPLTANQIIENIFGKGESQNPKGKRALDKPKGSRLQTQEVEIENPPIETLVQSRVKLDRFTGGVFTGALFQESPLFSTDKTTISFTLSLCNPKPEEVGLVLLVLKDLWTSDLPIGGESSVGRGRLRGMDARIVWGEHEWKFQEHDHRLQVVGSRQLLQDYVDALRRNDDRRSQ